MNYREQLLKEIEQTKSQLKKLEKIGMVQNEGTEQIERGNIESLAEEKMKWRRN